MKKSVPIETLPGFGDIEPNMYVIHSDGGQHYFRQCNIEVKQIYKENITYNINYKTVINLCN